MSKKRVPRKRKPAKKQTALARRQVSVVVNDPEGRLARAVNDNPFAPSVLSSEPMMTAAFIGTLKLTPDQIAALRRKVDDDEVEWKPAVHDGPAIIPYLSHNGYRDRLDAAFGLGGWGMVPVGMPKRDADFVYCPFALIVEGVPRVYAWGEQMVNKMTYGDALEGAKSNAIVRCGKELGIARELWNRKFLETLKARRHAGPEPGTPPARPAHDGKAGEPITLGQRERLWARAKAAGRTKDAVRKWLKLRYGLEDSSEIKRRDYETIVAMIDAPGPLTPGEEE